MYTFDDLRSADLPGPTVLTIGNFDGLHRGHQALLLHMREVANLSAGAGGPALTALLTFEPHPLSVLRPDIPNPLLTTPRERLELSSALGIDVGIIQPFTPEIAALEPREFLALLKRHLGLATLVMGPDFALGRQRAGDIPTLQALGRELGYRVEVMAPLDLGAEPVRSSRVRTLLQEGDAARAAVLLGRHYRVSGIVCRGDQRGRTVGIPTANVQPPPEKLLPADGVYATRALIASLDRVHVFDSVTNVGTRPTVDGQDRRVETHILGFPAPGQIDNLYGEKVAVDFVARLRGERRFGSVAELVAQIQQDIGQAQELLASLPKP
jgi:riboflavin kinase/FMN adenylyltransferase